MSETQANEQANAPSPTPPAPPVAPPRQPKLTPSWALLAAASAAWTVAIAGPWLGPDPGADAAPFLMPARAEVGATSPESLIAEGWLPIDAEFVAPWQPASTTTPRPRVARRRTDLPWPPRGFEARDEQAGAWWVRTFVREGEELAPQGPVVGGRLNLAESLHAARVSILRPDGTVRSCDRWVFGRWECGPDSWQFVGPSDMNVRGRSERCTWAHPHSEGVVSVRWTGVSAGRAVAGRMAVSDEAAENTDPGDVEFAVFVDGVEVGRRSQGMRRGFSMYHYTIPPEAGDVVDVEIQVSAPFVGQRHFCFDARIDDVGERDEPGQERRTGGERVRRLDGSGAGSGDGSGDDASDEGTAGPDPFRSREAVGSGAAVGPGRADGSGSMTGEGSGGDTEAPRDRSRSRRRRHPEVDRSPTRPQIRRESPALGDPPLPPAQPEDRFQ